MSQPETPDQPELRIRTGARFTLTVFRVLIYAEVFSNGKPINIYIYTNTFTLRHSMPLQKVQNNISEFNSFDYKISMFKKAMYAHVGVYTYCLPFSI